MCDPCRVGRWSTGGTASNPIPLCVGCPSGRSGSACGGEARAPGKGVQARIAHAHMCMCVCMCMCVTRPRPPSTGSDRERPKGAGRAPSAIAHALNGAGPHPLRALPCTSCTLCAWTILAGCRAGFGGPNCAVCSPGFYSPGGDAKAACIPCDNGTNTAFDGAVSKAFCTGE